MYEHMYQGTYTCTMVPYGTLPVVPVVQVRVPRDVHVYRACNLAHQCFVPVRTHVYHGPYIRTIMLCHNCLIGKGHTCARVVPLVRTRYHTNPYHNGMLCYNLVPWHSIAIWYCTRGVPCTIMLCHNFLIGKGHMSTCVLGGYTAAS
jgi:hypothetical protein